MFDAVCFGHVSLDTRLLIQNYPVENFGASMKKKCEVLGGDAAIIASNLSLLDRRVGLIGNGIGKDAVGTKILALLQEKQIITVLDEVYSDSSYIIVLVSEQSGSRTWIAYEMERFLLREPDSYDLQFLNSTKLVYVDSWFQRAAGRVIDKALEKNVKIIIHAGPWTPKHYISNADIVIRSSSDYHGVSSIELISKDLAIGVELTVVTQGEAGCVFGARNEIYQLNGHKVNCVDSTGAGATFTSGVIHAYLIGLPLLEIPIFANALAALKVTVFGNLEKINMEQIYQLSQRNANAVTLVAGNLSFS